MRVSEYKPVSLFLEEKTSQNTLYELYPDKVIVKRLSYTALGKQARCFMKTIMIAKTEKIETLEKEPTNN